MKNLNDDIKKEILNKLKNNACCEEAFNAGLNQDDSIVFKCKNCLQSFLRGLYTNYGVSNIFISENDLTISTGKGYSIEFLLYSNEFADFVAGALAENDIDIKMTLRQNKVLLYITDLNSIEHFLHLMGANKSLLLLENEALSRELRQKANREVNAAENNIKKHIEAVNKQIEQINVIDRLIGLSSLPVQIREVALARRENQNLTLMELAELLKISKSALNHRLRKVCEIYKNLI